METREFTSGDLLTAARLAWSIRKMHAAVRGLLIAWGIYVVFTYAALATGAARGEGFVSLFRNFEFFPFLPVQYAGVLSLAVWIVGIIAAVCTALLAAVSVSAVAVEDLRGNLMFQTVEAIRFARKQRSTVLAVMGALALLSLLFVAGCAVAALVGRIPVFGELALAVAALPLFFWALAGAAVILVFLFGFVTVPAIIAWTGEDALETLLQAFSLVWSRPVKFLLLQIAARIITAISMLLLGLLCFGALLLILFTAAPIAGFKLNELFTIALYRIPGLMDSELALRVIYFLCTSLGTPCIVDTTTVSTTVQTAGWILGVSSLLALAWIASYGFSVFYSAQVIIYRVLTPGKGGESAARSNDGTAKGSAAQEKTEPSSDAGRAVS